MVPRTAGIVKNGGHRPRPGRGIVAIADCQFSSNKLIGSIQLVGTGVAATPSADLQNGSWPGVRSASMLFTEVRPMDCRPGPFGIVLFAIGGLGCTGLISEQSPSDSRPGVKPPPGMNGGGKGGDVVPPPPMGPNAPGATPLRRLTVREYRNSLRDLLGITEPVRDLGGDQDAGGFAIGGPVTTSSDAARLLDAAELLA